MDLLSFYIEYEEKVLDLLIKKLSSSLKYGHKLLSHYRQKYEGVLYEFDLVELDRNEKIQRVYEIKTQRAVKTNFNFIKKILLKYRNVSKADVYLVYLNENEQMKIILWSHLVPIERNEVVEIRTIKSFPELYDVLITVCSDSNSELQYFFRGHSKNTFKPIPSVFRDGNIKYESRMFHEAIRRNPVDFVGTMSTFDQLVKMQHYELPTRLLDITTNPLIALYFACKEYKNEDGELLIYPMMREQIKYYDSDSVCVLSNLAKLPSNFIFTKDKDYLVYDIQQDKPSFKGKYLKADATKKVLCVMPKLNNERIICQQGAFFIFGMGASKDNPAQLTDEPIKIRILAEGKDVILKELQMLGINEATLFPETDKVMNQIKTELNRYY